MNKGEAIGKMKNLSVHGNWKKLRNSGNKAPKFAKFSSGKIAKNTQKVGLSRRKFVKNRLCISSFAFWPRDCKFWGAKPRKNSPKIASPVSTLAAIFEKFPKNRWALCKLPLTCKNFRVYRKFLLRPPPACSLAGGGRTYLPDQWTSKANFYQKNLPPVKNFRARKFLAETKIYRFLTKFWQNPQKAQERPRLLQKSLTHERFPKSPSRAFAVAGRFRQNQTFDFYSHIEIFTNPLFETSRPQQNQFAQNRLPEPRRILTKPPGIPAPCYIFGKRKFAKAKNAEILSLFRHRRSCGGEKVPPAITSGSSAENFSEIFGRKIGDFFTDFSAETLDRNFRLLPRSFFDPGAPTRQKAENPRDTGVDRKFT